MNKAEIFGLLFFALICCGAFVCAISGIGGGGPEPKEEALTPAMKRIEERQSKAYGDSTRVHRKTRVKKTTDSADTKRNRRTRQPKHSRPVPVPRERDYVSE